MCLSTNLNDSHLVRPVNVPPAGPSFQNTDAVLPEIVLKRCFPDNNLGQMVVLHSPQLCTKKTDQLSSMEAFLGLSKQNPTYAFWFFFQAHPGMPQNCHCLEKIGNSPIHFYRPLYALRGTVVLVVWYSYLYKLGTLS